MAVQAQYPSNGVNLPENQSSRARPLQFHHVIGNEVVDHRTSSFLNASSFLGKSPAFQIPSTVNMAGSNQYRLVNQLAGGRHGYAIDTAAIEKDRLMPGSNSGRKRPRDQAEDLQICSPWQQQQQLQQQQSLVMNNITPQPEGNPTTGPGSVVNPQSNNGVSTGLQLRLTLEDDRLRSASPVSTSGRVEPAKSSYVSAMAENFGSHLRQERDEITQLLKIQNEQLKSFLDEKRQRHAQQLVAAVEETYTRKLREKDCELEKAKVQNHELMERFNQLNAESHHWQTKVRNAEAMVNHLQANLRANLQQAQQQQFPLTNSHHQFNPCKEGCGDSEGADDCASSYVDDINDAHTRAFNENRELREQRTCRVCRTHDVSMLLLPCRHLCLCQDCETQLHACPLCRTPKNASVQVYMS